MKTIELEDTEALITAIALREYLELVGAAYQNRERLTAIGAHEATKGILMAIIERLDALRPR